MGRRVSSEMQMRCVCLHLKHISQVDTVPKQGEDDEIDGGPHARANTSLGADAIVHHLVPVLTRQDLQEKQTSSSVTCTFSSPGQPPRICPDNTQEPRTETLCSK